MKYHNASSTPQTLTGGGVLAPGEAIELKEVDQHLHDLIDAGLIIEVAEEEKSPPPPPPSSTSDKKGSS